jgi:hypothetical protein
MHWTSPGVIFLGVATVWLAVGVVLRDRSPVGYWYLIRYPVTWFRITHTWRPLAIERGLSVQRHSGHVMVGDLIVRGQEVRPIAPRVWISRPTRTGLSVRVRLLPGQTPEQYAQASEALMRSWRVHGVRVTSPTRGVVVIATYTPCLSGLATTREEAAELLSRLLDLTMERMGACKAAGVRSAWDLPEPPPPVVVIIDEVAELYLVTNPRDRDEQGLRDKIALTLLRSAHLGAALDVHLIVGGQRLGSDPGQGAMGLRARLGDRICMHVSDGETAVMVLGDIWPEAVATAQMIGVGERGTAVTGDGDGGWVRAWATLTSPEQPGDAAGEVVRVADSGSARDRRAVGGRAGEGE